MNANEEADVYDRYRECVYDSTHGIVEISLGIDPDEVTRLERVDRMSKVFDRRQAEHRRFIEDDSRAVVKAYRPTKQRMKFNRARKGWR